MRKWGRKRRPLVNHGWTRINTDFRQPGTSCLPSRPSPSDASVAAEPRWEIRGDLSDVPNRLRPPRLLHRPRPPDPGYRRTASIPVDSCPSVVATPRSCSPGPLAFMPGRGRRQNRTFARRIRARPCPFLVGAVGAGHARAARLIASKSFITGARSAERSTPPNASWTRR